MTSSTRSPTLSERVLTLEQKVDGIVVSLNHISNKLDEGTLNQKGDRRYVWQVVIGIMGLVLIPAISGIGVTMGLYVSNRMGPMEREVASLQSAIGGYARMQELNVTKIGVLERELASESATRKMQWIEQETQIASLENNHALLSWHQEVINHILSQNKGITLPTAPIPQVRISNRNTK